MAAQRPQVSLLVVPFAEKRGIPYCKDCAISMFAEVARLPALAAAGADGARCQPCAGCGKMITGAYLAAFGVKYHPACFLCAAGTATATAAAITPHARALSAPQAAGAT